jgi:hypothetical protein
MRQRLSQSDQNEAVVRQPSAEAVRQRNEEEDVSYRVQRRHVNSRVTIGALQRHRQNARWDQRNSDRRRNESPDQHLVSSAQRNLRPGSSAQRNLRLGSSVRRDQCNRKARALVVP